MYESLCKGEPVAFLIFSKLDFNENVIILLLIRNINKAPKKIETTIDILKKFIWFLAPSNFLEGIVGIHLNQIISLTSFLSAINSSCVILNFSLLKSLKGKS